MSKSKPNKQSNKKKRAGLIPGLLIAMTVTAILRFACGPGSGPGQREQLCLDRCDPVMGALVEDQCWCNVNLVRPQR